jgi:hypothetical protein
VAGVYSHRFIFLSGTTPAHFIVPAGKTAVVKGITVVNPSTLGQQGVLYIANVPVWVASVPGNSSALASNQFLVVNPGEDLSMALTESSMHGTVSGYLLDQLV